MILPAREAREAGKEQTHHFPRPLYRPALEDVGSSVKMDLSTLKDSYLGCIFSPQMVQ